jgi:hypothetical protein
MCVYSTHYNEWYRIAESIVCFLVYTTEENVSLK